MGTATMARPKANSKAKPKAQPKTQGANPIAITVRGPLEWREWVEQGAAHCRTDVAKLVDAALIEYLKGKGFAETPPKR